MALSQSAANPWQPLILNCSLLPICSINVSRWHHYRCPSIRMQGLSFSSSLRTEPGAEHVLQECERKDHRTQAPAPLIRDHAGWRRSASQGTCRLRSRGVCTSGKTVLNADTQASWQYEPSGGLGVFPTSSPFSGPCQAWRRLYSGRLLCAGRRAKSSTYLLSSIRLADE